MAMASLALVACAHTTPQNVRPMATLSNESTSLRYFPPPLALAEAEDAIVRIVGPQTSCSGTLIAEDLVLTAHHCVVKLDDHGRYTAETVNATDMVVELGGDYLPWGNIATSAVVVPPCGEAGGMGDVAILVLARKLIGITPYTVRLDAAPKVGETLDPAGFGRCSTSANGIHREVREGGPVTGISPGMISMTASVCPGDSGGPVFSRGSHEVVGVVSLSAMDGDSHTRNPSIMARIDAMRPLFAQARLIADGASKNELPPLSCR